MGVYLQHCEPNYGCKNLEKKYLQCGMNTMENVKALEREITQNKTKYTMSRMKQLNGCQTERK